MWVVEETGLKVEKGAGLQSKLPAGLYSFWWLRLTSRQKIRVLALCYILQSSECNVTDRLKAHGEVNSVPVA